MQKEVKQKDIREPTTTESKELLIQTPRLETLVNVAKQAIENLREWKEATAHDLSLKVPLNKF